jgi:DNA-binding NarL/FixJ family response regulator
VQTLRIVIVDDSTEFLESAVGFLRRDPRVEVVGRASNAWEGVRMAVELKPHLVLMDLVMPVMNGLVATRCIKAWPDPPSVVIVSMHESAEYRDIALESLADGFVCKSQFVNQVPELIDGMVGSRGAADVVAAETIE